MSKVKTLAMLGVGYVLGARAGRQRYEQVKAQAVRVSEHPRTQHLAQQARDTVATRLPSSVTSRFGLGRGTGTGTTIPPSHG